MRMQYICLRGQREAGKEGGREGGCSTGDVGGRKEERWWVRVAAVVEGCKRRNKSSQSNLWQWLLQCH